MPGGSLFLRINISWILSCNAIDKLIDALFRMKDKMAGIADGMEINFGTFLLRDVNIVNGKKCSAITASIIAVMPWQKTVEKVYWYYFSKLNQPI